MTLNTFFKIIKNQGKISVSQNEIAYDLFKKSGIHVSDSTVDSWLKVNSNGKRTPNCAGEIIDEAGFINYFKTRTKSTWQDMQIAFSETDNYNLIDCDTKDADAFYRSLLMLFYELLRMVPISLHHILPEKPFLIGRESELKQINEIFKISNYAVLTGIGGIGKSHVALAYAHTLNEMGGWTIQHIICEDSDTLQKAIGKLQFDGLQDSKNASENNNIESRISALKNIQKPKLIILDNLNRPFSSDNDRRAFTLLADCGPHVRILITSRNTLNVDKKHLVHISALDNDSLLALYKYYRFKDFSDHESYIKKCTDTLEKIFALVECHTFMIILLAQLPERNLLSEEKIYKQLNEGVHLPLEPVNITKDGAFIESTIKEVVKKVFDIFQLTDTEKSIMTYMCLIPLIGIELDLFEKLTNYSSKDIKALVCNHWIISDSETLRIRLHPLICDTILSFNETRPSKEMCDEFSSRILIMRKSSIPKSQEWHTLNKILACIATRVLFPIIQEITTSEEPYTNLFDSLLNEEERNSLLALNNLLREYADSDFPMDTNKIEDK